MIYTGDLGAGRVTCYSKPLSTWNAPWSPANKTDLKANIANNQQVNIKVNMDINARDELLQSYQFMFMVLADVLGIQYKL